MGSKARGGGRWKEGVRPEEAARPEDWYTTGEAARYSKNSVTERIQTELTSVALDLASAAAPALANADEAHLVGDLGCGSGLSGAVLHERGLNWIGADISENMLQIAQQSGGPARGATVQANLAHPLPLRNHVLDAAISISAVQWLCFPQPNKDDPAAPPATPPNAAIDTFFRSAARCLRPGAPAVLQVYPGSSADLRALEAGAARHGMRGGAFAELPHGGTTQKYFMCLTAPDVTPAPSEATGKRAAPACSGEERSAPPRKLQRTDGRAQGRPDARSHDALTADSGSDSAQTPLRAEPPRRPAQPKQLLGPVLGPHGTAIQRPCCPLTFPWVECCAGGWYNACCGSTHAGQERLRSGHFAHGRRALRVLRRAMRGTASIVGGGQAPAASAAGEARPSWTARGAAWGIPGCAESCVWLADADAGSREAADDVIRGLAEACKLADVRVDVESDSLREAPGEVAVAAGGPPAGAAGGGDQGRGDNMRWQRSNVQPWAAVEVGCLACQGMHEMVTLGVGCGEAGVRAAVMSAQTLCAAVGASTVGVWARGTARGARLVLLMCTPFLPERDGTTTFAALEGALRTVDAHRRTWRGEQPLS